LIYFSYLFELFFNLSLSTFRNSPVDDVNRSFATFIFIFIFHPGLKTFLFIFPAGKDEL